MELFEQFVKERRYMKNVSPATEQWYKYSWKALGPYVEPCFTAGSNGNTSRSSPDRRRKITHLSIGFPAPSRTHHRRRSDSRLDRRSALRKTMTRKLGVKNVAGLTQLALAAGLTHFPKPHGGNR